MNQPFLRSRLSCVALLFAVCFSSTSKLLAEEPRELFLGSKRILFLGDSITAAGGYVSAIEAWLQTTGTNKLPEIINCGLPSETVSGLSEEGHAGGKFPRPDLAERLDRVLALVKPDLVFACYGMNCGIYQPFDEARFKAYQQGIENLKAAVEKAGAKLVLITPPIYDDKQKPNSFSYNGVLDQYCNWLLGKRKEGWQVIDLHTPMTEATAERRKSDPNFTFAGDAVHPGGEGHWFIAQQILRWLGDESAAAAKSPEAMLKAASLPPEIAGLSAERVGTLRDAYVATAGHKRPGVAKGMSVPDAEKKAAELRERMTALKQK